MPHDNRGEILSVGDVVLVPCRVKAIHLTEEYCNVDLETKETMYPSAIPTKLTLNSRQVVKPRVTYEYKLAVASPEEKL
jgi:hypothetical protein